MDDDGPRPATARPRRVRVVGTSGAGKTTVSRRAAARLGVPHLELDALQNKAGWEPSTPEEFAAGVAAFLATAPDGWVVDGSYRQRVAWLDDLADTLVWVDPPRAVVMARVLRRTVTGGIARRTLWNGNRESLRTLVRRDPEQNIVLWSWRTFAGNRARYAPLAAGDPRWVRLATRRATRRWLESL